MQEGRSRPGQPSPERDRDPTTQVDQVGTPLSGELALVTGAGRRIGQTIATRIARAGADVIVHHRTSTKGAQATAQAVSQADRQAWTLQADLASASDVDGLIEAASDLAGRPPTLLVNNASVFPQDRLGDLTLETFLSTLQVNAWAPLALTRALAQAVERGAVVNLLDARVGHADRRRIAYASSKDLLASITQLLAVELAPTLRVNGVAPGPILAPTDGPADAFEEIARRTPMGWHGHPEDVADAVVHLLAAPYTTGTLLPVSGGQHLLAGVGHRG